MIAFGIYLLKVSVCLIGFYALYAAFFKRTTFFHLNRSYLLLALIISFATPAMKVSPFGSHSAFISAPSARITLSALENEFVSTLFGYPED